MDPQKKVLMVRQRKRRELLFKSWSYAFHYTRSFGNRASAWETIDKLKKSKWQGNICILDKRGTQRGNKKAVLPIYNIPKEKLNEVIQESIYQGAPLEAMTFNEAMPDQHLLIQGEVTRAIDGTLHLTYTLIQKPMRAGLLEKTEFAKGLKAKIILEHFLWQSSLQEIMHCLDYFSTGTQNPTPTIEFSTYSIPVGDTAGHNTVIWEVRNY